MTDLSSLQGKFKNAVMKNKEASFLDEIEEGGKISREQRLHIYAHAYGSRLKEVLADDYPVFNAMVGDSVFNDICSEYIDLHPSQHPSLRFFGAKMEQFLKNHKTYAAKTVLAEMAKFEWTFNDVFDAEDGGCVIIEDVAKIPPEAWTTLRMHFHPSFEIKEYKWNVPAVWSSVQEDENNPVMPEEYEDYLTCIQWRADLVCYFRTISEQEVKPITLAFKNNTFPDICESLSVEYGDEAPMHAAGFFKGWIEEGLISKLEYLKI